MKEDKKYKFERKKGKCKMCGSQKGVIKKYDLNLCRRCFKQNAEKLGFEKFD